MKYCARIKKEKDGSLLVSFKDLDGCMTYGETLEEAKANASEALHGWLCSFIVKGDSHKIPKPKAHRGCKDCHQIEVEKTLQRAISFR